MFNLDKKKILTWSVGLIAFVVLCFLSNGWIMVLFALFGFWSALTQNKTWSIISFTFLPILVCLNPFIVPYEGMVQNFARITLILMYIVMAISSILNRVSNVKIPVGGLFVYLLVACISSINGWAPNVSYMKIVNFLVFLLALWAGIGGLDRDVKALDKLHIAFFVLILFLSFGSIATLPFPAIAYQQHSSSLLHTMGMDQVADVVREQMSVGRLMVFAGVTYNSQCLGPLLACAFNWVLCDMLFIVQRFSKMHIATLIAILIPLYLTRSRTALFALCIGIVIVAILTINQVRISNQAKTRAKAVMRMLLFFGIIVMILLEMKSNTMSGWIRKTNDARNDAREFGDALTDSRQKSIEENLIDFNMNRIFGMGFQVMPSHKERYAGKVFVFSAPIEKGLLPLMILGETGIVGAIVFLCFLLTFYFSCAMSKMYITATMFTVLLATNFGEATFFSPGGSGGAIWMMGVVGGYIQDMIIRARRNNVACREVVGNHW